MLGSGKLPAVPCCPICCDFLGACGGPATLPCGHNGCRNCLAELQQRPNPACPLCRSPVPAGFILVPNTELRDLVSLATSMLLTDERERQEGWEAFPDKSLASEQYASDLKLGREAAEQQQLLSSAPSAPPAPHALGPSTAAACRELMQLPPPQWLPDSMASACGACGRAFRPLTRLRHHCRCCGRIFCAACSSQRTLLPPQFNTREPQRACDTCVAMLGPLQHFLASTRSPAAQPPVHDAVMDAVSLRSWLHSPYSRSLEDDVNKAANVLAKFTQASRLQPEAHLPTAVLAGARGLVVMSVLKMGAAWSATFGTGLVVARSPEGAWSAPCALACLGLGWGLQLGGELTDLLLVLRTDEAVRAFCGAVHVGLGGSLGVSLGPLGRSADATMLVGSANTSPAAAYAYSCSQGAFAGISIEGSILTVREDVNRAFYGLPVSARSLLVERSVAPPPAAAALYDALHSLTCKYENRRCLAPPNMASLALPFAQHLTSQLVSAASAVATMITGQAGPSATDTTPSASTASSFSPAVPLPRSSDYHRPPAPALSRSSQAGQAEGSDQPGAEPPRRQDSDPALHAGKGPQASASAFSTFSLTPHLQGLSALSSPSPSYYPSATAGATQGGSRAAEEGARARGAPWVWRPPAAGGGGRGGGLGQRQQEEEEGGEVPRLAALRARGGTGAEQGPTVMGAQRGLVSRGREGAAAQQVLTHQGTNRGGGVMAAEEEEEEEEGGGFMAALFD